MLVFKLRIIENLKQKKMKYILNSFNKRAVLLALLFAGFSACDEDAILEEVPQDTLTTGNLYSSVHTYDAGQGSSDQLSSLLPLNHSL